MIGGTTASSGALGRVLMINRLLPPAPAGTLPSKPAPCQVGECDRLETVRKFFQNKAGIDEDLRRYPHLEVFEVTGFPGRLALLFTRTDGSEHSANCPQAGNTS